MQAVARVAQACWTLPDAFGQHRIVFNSRHHCFRLSLHGMGATQPPDEPFFASVMSNLLLWETPLTNAQQLCSPASACNVHDIGKERLWSRG